MFCYICCSRLPKLSDDLLGSEFTNSLDEILTHLFNHSSHHRGQINREISRAGGDAPLVGFIHYARGEHG